MSGTDITNLLDIVQRKINGARKQKRKTQVKQIKKKKVEQRQIAEYEIKKYKEDEGLGARIMSDKCVTDLIFYLQNPDGVMAMDKELDDRRALLTLQEWEVDVIDLPETNKNWQQEWIQNQ